MRNFLIRVVINAIAVAVAAKIVPGFITSSDSLGTLLIIGLVLGIVNALLKPIITFLTCPLVILTLGLFVLVINGLLLEVAALILPNTLKIETLGNAIIAGIVISIVNMILEVLFGVRENRRTRHQTPRIEHRKL